MPVKRRAAKAKRQLNTQDVEDLLYGPGTCLFNGEGYMGPYDDARFEEVSPEVQAAVLAAMREDWERQWSLVMDTWRNRSPHDIWCAKNHYGNPPEPWALTQFGEPK